MYLVPGPCVLYLRNAVGDTDDYLVQLAPKHLTYYIKMLNSFRNFMV